MGPKSRRARTPVLNCKSACRVNRTLTLSPRTEALLEAWARTTGIPRGRIVDLAMSCLKACDACRGRGTVDGVHGPDTETCLECRGDRLMPV